MILLITSSFTAHLQVNITPTVLLKNGIYTYDGLKGDWIMPQLIFFNVILNYFYHSAISLKQPSISLICKREQFI